MCQARVWSSWRKEVLRLDVWELVLDPSSNCSIQMFESLLIGVDEIAKDNETHGAMFD